MTKNFQIVNPQFTTSGDYVSFTIIDGEQHVPARISRTALAVLDQGNNNESSDVFESHREQIRTAAMEMRKRNPTLDMVFLCSINF